MKDENLKQAVRNMAAINEKYGELLFGALCDEIPEAFQQKLNFALTAMGVRDYNDCYYDPVHEIYMAPSIFEYDNQVIDFYHLLLDEIKVAARSETMDDLVKKLDDQKHIGSIGVSVEDGGFLSDNDFCLDEIEDRLACDSRWFETGGMDLDEIAALSDEILAKDRISGNNAVKREMHLSEKAHAVLEADNIHEADKVKSDSYLSGDAR